MWVLLAVSVAGFVIFLERALYLHRGQLKAESFLEGLRNLLTKRRLIEAVTVCEEAPGPVPRVVKAALLLHDAPESEMRAAVQQAGMVELPALERRLGSLAAIARIGPLLGFLGTALALFATARGLGTAETAAYPSFALVMTELGHALLTTITGLGIAVMAHLAHHFLSGRVRAIVGEMEFAGHAMMQFLLHELPETSEEEAKEAGI